MSMYVVIDGLVLVMCVRIVPMMLCVLFVVRRVMFRLCPTSFANKVGTSSDQDGADIVV